MVAREAASLAGVRTIAWRRGSSSPCRFGIGTGPNTSTCAGVPVRAVASLDASSSPYHYVGTISFLGGLLTSAAGTPHLDSYVQAIFETMQKLWLAEGSEGLEDGAIKLEGVRSRRRGKRLLGIKGVWLLLSWPESSVGRSPR